MSRPAWFIGPWDLDRRLACVPEDPRAGTIVMVESVGRSRALPFHRKKLVLVVSALRHFAEELCADGFTVDVRRASSYARGIAAHVAEHGSTEVIALAPRDWGIDQSLRTAELGAPLRLHDDGGPDGHFLLRREEFLGWAEGRKSLRMDQFYRWMRKRTGLLMDGKKPVGGKWSYDKDNRKPAKHARPPALPTFPPDALTQQVMAEVDGWGIGWAETEGFGWPVTRTDALHALERFVDERLVLYGDHQDAMLTGEPFLWHACISPALNLGLLSPQDLLDAVLASWEAGTAPLNAVEGFVRQVIGWREFIRGVYWLRMPQLREANQFSAEAPLPAAFWEPARTDMACLRDALDAVYAHGYAHHIQRLMVLGNLALLLGVRPLELSHWFWAAFVDAYEWVELPNVHGMALAADPSFTTKPYAASGSYIHRMSDHCGRCVYKVRQRSGPHACPFNALFWDFMVRHRDTLADNPRVAVLYRSWDRWDADEQGAILQTADHHRARLLQGPRPQWEVHDDQG
jgi:deoxyribodipyrimidine photolyase-related protein